MKSFLRVIIGLIFIASGFVKAVDPTGFSFKLEEYFGAGVFNLPFLEPYTLAIAIIVVLIELLLGVALVLKIKVKRTLASLIILCIFFGFLTFYSAYFDKVTDCGCFGDAIKFTPWQSFAKDMILLLGLIILAVLYRKENRTKSSKLSQILLIIAFIFSLYCIRHGIVQEPLIDFRSYKIGTDLNLELKKIKAQPSEYTVIYTLKNKTKGEEKRISQNEYIADQNYWKQDSPWSIDPSKTESKLVKEGYQSEVAKLKLEDQFGNDLTSEVLAAPKAVIVFAYQPNKLEAKEIQALEEKLKNLSNTYILGVAPSTDVFKTIRSASMDGTAIKTIARSNPFVLILEKGIIKDKLPAADFLNQ